MNFRHYFTFTICFVAIACNPKQDGLAGKSFQSNTVYPSLPDTILQTLENGDIIIRKGNGPLSFHLSRTTGEDYTHCGIILKEKGKLGIIHTLGSDASHNGIDGVQMQSLEGFVKQAADSCLFICRPIFRKSIGDSIVKSAKKYLQKKVPFDYGFSLLTEDKFYCSELLYYVFKDVNNNQNIFHITKKNKSHILMFSTFFVEENFKPVFNLNPKQGIKSSI